MAANISEVLARNGLQSTKFDTCCALADRGTAVRTVFETVARLLTAYDSSYGEYAKPTEDGVRAFNDARAILDEVLR